MTWLPLLVTVVSTLMMADRSIRAADQLKADGISAEVIDLRWLRPLDMPTVREIVRQAWEMGETSLTLSHGHGRNRGISPGFVNTNTGHFGLCLRRALRNDRSLRQWIFHTTLDCRAMGSTSVKLKPNPAPTREEVDCLPGS